MRDSYYSRKYGVTAVGQAALSVFTFLKFHRLQVQYQEHYIFRPPSNKHNITNVKLISVLPYCKSFIDGGRDGEWTACVLCGPNKLS